MDGASPRQPSLSGRADKCGADPQRGDVPEFSQIWQQESVPHPTLELALEHS
jgi:hypothetical protein